MIPSSAHRQAAALVRSRIENSGERVWKVEDFADLPYPAVAQALSRLTRSGFIQRLSKGIYYRARSTPFGVSKPNPSQMAKLVKAKHGVYPAGVVAANQLGFTTQTPATPRLATHRLSLPRKLIGPDVIVHTRRPEAWGKLSASEAALLDFLRRGGRTSELSEEQTIDRTLGLLKRDGVYRHLLAVAASEPPRVRALLGALGERLGRSAKELTELRQSLNPFSRFDFGTFGNLPNARAWQAKAHKTS